VVKGYVTTKLISIVHMLIELHALKQCAQGRIKLTTVRCIEILCADDLDIIDWFEERNDASQPLEAVNDGSYDQRSLCL
jgi:hypothetical protein